MSKRKAADMLPEHTAWIEHASTSELDGQALADQFSVFVAGYITAKL